MKQDARIYVAGSDTLVGAAILRAVKHLGYTNIVGGLEDKLDLTDAAEVDAFIGEGRPDYVFCVAGKSGGIDANQRFPADLMVDNLLVQTHVMRSVHQHGAKKLLYLASSCSYPRECSQPMRVESLMTGPLEPTNEAYAVAKIAGMTLCRAFRQQYGAPFISAIPANPYGPGDDFCPKTSHVIPALIRRLYLAREANDSAVQIWGTGAARREFIFIDDLAAACVFVMREYDAPQPINLGSSSDVSIEELAELVKEVVGYRGVLEFDTSKPDGMPRKSLDSRRLLEMGWKPSTTLRAGIEATFDWWRCQA
jgi:GDP-L-fucose synthase